MEQNQIEELLKIEEEMPVEIATGEFSILFYGLLESLRAGEDVGCYFSQRISKSKQMDYCNPLSRGEFCGVTSAYSYIDRVIARVSFEAWSNDQQFEIWYSLILIDNAWKIYDMSTRPRDPQSLLVDERIKSGLPLKSAITGIFD